MIPYLFDRVLVSVALCVVVSNLSDAQPGSQSRLAVPVEPIRAVLEAFRSHTVVALDEGDHGNEQGHAFRLALIRDPEFATIVNDIVVETGNARYQALMDRFIQGEEVTEASLREVWQNTTQPHFAGDMPIYEEFFRAVRVVNASLPRERRLRVLLGDPPIDWETVRTPEQHLKWIALRDTHAADVIRREVLAKGRRALVVYGGWHLQRRNIDTNYELTDDGPLVSLLEDRGQTNAFTIWTNTMADLEMLQADVVSWHRPSLAMVRGTTLGAVDFTFYFPFDGDRINIRDGKPVLRPRAEWRQLQMEDQFDAVLYLGPRSTITYARLSPALCAEPTYMQMRLGRMLLVGMQDEADRLKRYCRTE